MHGGGEICEQNFVLESLKERCHSEDLSIDTRMMLKSLETRMEGMDWIYLAQDKDWW
jgi:hypothetical protein